MLLTITGTVAKEAAKYLAEHDAVLAPVIKRAGICTLRPHNNYYWELVDAIISQQISIHAAASIEKRFQEYFDSKTPAPKQILEKSVDELHGIGLTRQKASYIHDLALHISEGKLELEKFTNFSNDKIMKELTAVKGIGEWTAHMFLMFCMARPDVLPTGDLGIRNSIRKLYGFEHVPTPEEIRALSAKNQWAPYESIASWYIWQNLGNAPAL